MSSSFAQRFVDAAFNSPMSCGALYALPGESPAIDGEGVRVIPSMRAHDDYGVQNEARIVEIRGGDEGLPGGVPIEGAQFLLDIDAPLWPGEAVEIIGEPRRLDPARLIYTCIVQELRE